MSESTLLDSVVERANQYKMEVEFAEKFVTRVSKLADTFHSLEVKNCGNILNIHFAGGDNSCFVNYQNDLFVVSRSNGKSILTFDSNFDSKTCDSFEKCIALLIHSLL